MKNLSKAILIACAAVVALAGAGVVGLHLFLKSATLQVRLQEEISRALRMPLKITKSEIGLGGRIELTGISIPNGDATFLEAASFRARLRLPPLLRGRVEVDEIVMDSPKIRWPQTAEGKWELPTAPRAAATAASEPPAGAPPAKPAPDGGEKPKSKRAFEVVLGPVHVQHGSVDLLDKAGQRVASFQEVDMLYTSLSSERIEGNVKIGRLLWNEKVPFDDVHAGFNYSRTVLDIPALTASVGGGPLTASFKVQFAEARRPFTFAMKFDQVDLGRVSREAAWGEGQGTGRVAGEIALEGSYPRFLAGEGPVSLTLEDGRFQEFSYFEMIGQVLQIRQLSDLRLKQSTLTGRIADEKLHIEHLSIDAADLKIVAKGVTRFEDGKLQLASRLIAQDALVQQLPGLVRDNFLPGESGTRYIEFNITGKTSKPKTDLLDKVVGKKLESQFDDLVNSLFGTKKKKDDKGKDEKKKKPEPPAEKAASPPPATPPEAPAPSQ